ncbi:MAG: four helix bundle protein [Alistipes sp.]|jgi:four helix bundle protein|nr:four helix bundle protein [Alistipes sp.]
MLQNKSFAFGVKVVGLSQYLQTEIKDYSISKQVLRSGTAIGALICEAEFAQSRADFVSKMSIALKEANETRYWIRLLNASEYINDQQSEILLNDITEIISMLVKSIKTAKNNS